VTISSPEPQLPPGREPLLSVIVATYNRSNVLRHTIESVLRSSVSDFELLVIGDACTDDSADVVAAFGDRRIAFTNLARNFGEQSGPNNHGCRAARGRFIAYLNHDDFYFPDHLEAAIACLERSGADLAYAPVAAAARRSREELARGDLRFILHGASASGRYEPYVFVPASAWVLRRELASAVGPWRPAVECYTESSQDWLFRAWKQGRSLRCTGKLGVLTLPTGERQGVYANREEHENRYYAGRLRDDPRLLREQILGGVALDLAARKSFPGKPLSMKRFWRKLSYAPCLRLGVHPRAAKTLVRGWGRGRGIHELRRIRGLRPLER